MSDVNIVASCSLGGWSKYGQRFLETFRKFWPTTVHLHIVSEDTLPIHPTERETSWNLYTHPPAKRFLNANEGVLWKHGQGGVKRPSGIAQRWLATSGYAFRYDAYKFSKKVFAIELIAHQIHKGRLFWVDADTLTHDTVPHDMFERLLPSDFALSCLSRQGYHSECGFVGYNLNQAACHNFIGAFSAVYETEAVFSLAEWHDSWVFDYIRNKLMIRTYGIPHRSKGHPFINSELGRYMDHLKGKRKETGSSQKVEQVAHRNVEYWK